MNIKDSKTFFKDPSIIASFVKLCLIFGPGFLAIGYFDRAAFVQLDWLKLLTVSALFSFIFIGPPMTILWLGLNLPVWSIKASYAKYKRKFNKHLSRTEFLANELLSITKSLKNKKIDSKTKAKINDLGDSINDSKNETREIIAGIDKRQAALSKTHDSLEIGFWRVLLDNWLYLAILFVQVLLIVAVDYFSSKRHITMRQLLTYLAELYYLILPLLMLGSLSLLYATKFQSGKRRYFTMAMGVALIACGFFVIIKIKSPFRA